MTPHLDMALATDRGRVRPHNEDALAVDAECGLAVLADGLGGHNAGEVASRMAVQAIISGMTPVLCRQGSEPLDRKRVHSLIKEHIGHANAQLYQAGREHWQYAGMGTTIVVAIWHDDRVTVGHIGDSRMYRFRAQELTPLTHDHSLAQEQFDRGVLSAEATRTASSRSTLTRTVGNAHHVSAELNTFEVVPDDLYLMCSDGLTDMLKDEQIGEALLLCGSQMQHAADQLVEQANNQGGADNISVILVRLSQAARQGSQ